MLRNVKEALSVTNLGTIAFAQLAKIFPLPVIQEALEQTNRPTYRLRELPNELMVYFPMMMALHREQSSTEVLRWVLEGSANVFGRKSDELTGKGGISTGRIRVGWEPLKLVFDWLAKPLAEPGAINCHFAGRRIMAVDGVLINVSDTENNANHFGRSTNQHELSGVYPKTRVVALGECGTHAVVGAVIGTYHDSEVTLARIVLQRITGNDVLLADRLFFGWELFNQVHQAGAKLVWRIKQVDYDKFKLKAKDRLPDGSYKAWYKPPASTKSDCPFTEPIEVRLVTYRVQGSTEKVHLVTTFLDPEEAGPTQLAALYKQRWEIELVFKEMKVQLNKNEAALRSKTPDLVRQELYGLLMTHYAIRSLMYEAAVRAKLDPDDLSFIGAVRAVQRKSLTVGGDFSP